MSEQRKPQPSGRHTRPGIHWVPAEGLGEWVRELAQEQGIPISHALNGIVGRARQESLGLPVPPSPELGRPRRSAAPQPERAGRLPPLREVAARAAALREMRDTEGEGQ